MEFIARGGTRLIASTTSATWDGAAEIVSAAVEEFGRLDILVNNATAAVVNDLWRMTEKEWDLAIDVNLKGYFAMYSLLVTGMFGVWYIPRLQRRRAELIAGHARSEPSPPPQGPAELTVPGQGLLRWRVPAVVEPQPAVRD